MFYVYILCLCTKYNAMVKTGCLLMTHLEMLTKYLTSAILLNKNKMMLEFLNQLMAKARSMQSKINKQNI